MLQRSCNNRPSRHHYQGQAVCILRSVNLLVVDDCRFARANGIDKVEFVILDLTPVPHMDSMGCHFLEDLNEVSKGGSVQHWAYRLFNLMCRLVVQLEWAIMAAMSRPFCWCFCLGLSAQEPECLSNVVACSVGSRTVGIGSAWRAASQIGVLVCYLSVPASF